MEPYIRKRGDLPFPREILQDFFDLLTERQEKWGEIYLATLRANLLFLDVIIEKDWFKDLPKLFEKLIITLESDNSCDFLNQTHFLQPNLFKPPDEAYRTACRLKSKEFFALLKTPIDEEDPDSLRKYFRSFIEATTFLCANYGYSISTDLNHNHVVVKTDNTITLSRVKQYYLFYNRSELGNEKIGVGSIKITDDKTVQAEFYYNPGTRAKPGAKYKSLILKGMVDRKSVSSILILKKLTDIEPDLSTEGIFKQVEHHFVLKYFTEYDKIILGTSTWWNRDLSYPAASAIVLVEKNFYDTQYTSNELYYFDKIRNSRTYKNVPPEIMYYLLHQVISLEPVLEEISRGDKNQIFSDLYQIPFFKKDGELLGPLAGSYKGLSIVHKNRRDKEKDILVISKLEIEASGIVHLKVLANNVHNVMAEESTKGYVRRVKADESGNGELIITLRYKDKKYYNTLSFYLSFEDVYQNIKTTEKEGFFLKGGFAGVSIITNKPSASSLIFEKLGAKESVELMQIEIPEKKYPLNDVFTKLFQQHTNLFNFFLERDNVHYSNNAGVENLQFLFGQHTKINAKHVIDTSNEVFIAIPLSHHDDEKEYEKNCSLVSELRKELTERYLISDERIYCACFHKQQVFSFQDYQSYMNTPVQGYLDVREKLETSKALIFVYPAFSKSQPAHTSRISSAIVEVAYALGLGKNVVLLLDKHATSSLPKNLIILNQRRTFEFDSTLDNPIQKNIFIGRYSRAN